MPQTLRQQLADETATREEYAQKLFTDTHLITYRTPGLVCDIDVTLQEILLLVKEGATITVAMPHA